MQRTRYCCTAYLHTLGNKKILSFFWYTNVRSLGQTLNSGSDLAFIGILFLLLNVIILFLYSLGNQHSADLPFHVMCYRCCLQLPQFAAHVWMNSVTSAMFHCILHRKLLLVCWICFWHSCNDREDLFFNVMYFLLAMNLPAVTKWPISIW